MKELSKSFKDFEIIQILRLENTRADALSHLATSGFFELNQRVLIDVLERPGIEVLSIVQIDHEPS